MLERVKRKEHNDGDKCVIGTVEQNVADSIKNITGIDTTGFIIAIEARQIEHILKDHGENGKSDSSMSSIESIKNIADVTKSPDYISPSGNTNAYSYTDKNGKNKTANTVILEKTISEKSHYVVVAVADTNAKTLYIVTSFIGQQGYKRKGALQLNDADNSPTATPKDDFANAPTTSSITKKSKKVNTKSKKSSDKKSKSPETQADDKNDASQDNVSQDALFERRYTAKDIVLCRSLVEDFDFYPVEVQDRLLTTARSGRQSGASEQQIKEAVMLSHKTGTGIAFSNVIKSDGMFLTVDGNFIILENPKVKSRVPTLLHEMTHRMKKTGGWDRVSKYVREVIGEEKFKEFRDDYKENYDKWQAERKAEGVTVPDITDAQLDEEAIADACAYYLKKLPYLENKTAKGFIKKAYASITSMVKVIRKESVYTYKTARRIQKLYEGMLNEVERNQALRDAGVLFETGDNGGIMHSFSSIASSLFSNPNMTSKEMESLDYSTPSFAERHQEEITPNIVVLDEMNWLQKEIEHGDKSASQVLKEYIFSAFVGKSITFPNGVVAVVDKNDAKKIVHHAGKVKTAEVAKLQKIIDNCVLAAENIEASHDKFDMFNYYICRVQFGEKVFDISIDVGHGKFDGKYHLYSIQEKKSNRRTKALSSPVGHLKNDYSSTDSIPDSAENVNPSDEKNPKILRSPSAPDPNNPYDHVDTTMPDKETLKEKMSGKRWKEIVKELAEQAQIELINQQAGIENYLVRVGGMSKIQAASYVQMVRTSEAYGCGVLTTGQYSIDGKRVGDALYTILQPIWNEAKGTWNDELYHDFGVYMTNLHNIDRQREDKPVIVYTNDEIKKKTDSLKEKMDNAVKKAKAEGKSEQEIDQIESEYKKKIRDIERQYAIEMSQKAVELYETKHPEFKEMAEKIATFVRNLNQFRVDTGLLSQATADELNAKYPHYIPTYRVTDGVKLGTGSLRGRYNFEVTQSVSIFQFTPPVGEETYDTTLTNTLMQFQSTPPVGEETYKKSPMTIYF